MVGAPLELAIQLPGQFAAAAGRIACADIEIATPFRGLGQRVLTSSGPEKGLLDVREIVLAPPA